jgi:hypothetical protein
MNVKFGVYRIVFMHFRSVIVSRSHTLLARLFSSCCSGIQKLFTVYQFPAGIEQNNCQVPVDGFVSVTVYNAEGFMEKNEMDAYSINNVTAEKNADGSVTIHFGGDPGKPNYLPITPGWNYAVRMYQPRKAIIDDTWKFPKAEPVE